MASQLPNPYGAGAMGLPNPYAAATVAESAPVKFSEEQAKAEQKKTPAFHNPHHIKRPQAKGAIAKKPAMARPIAVVATAATVTVSDDASTATQQPSLDWWRSTADDDAAALEYKREMDRHQREKKKQEKKFAKQFGFWKGEAPYKADRPSNLRAYKASGAYQFKLDSFAEFVQQQVIPPTSRDASPDVASVFSEDLDPAPNVSQRHFAPPATYDRVGRSDSPMSDIIMADAPSEEDPYARRMRLSQPSTDDAPPPPPSQIGASVTTPLPYAAVPPPAPPPTEPPLTAAIPPPAPPPYNPVISAPSARYNPTISAPPVRYEHATISAAPIRYDVPEKIDEPPQERPAKRAKLSKAEAMMAKMGYKKGEGLGKNSDGITTHLEVKARKVDKRAADVADDFDDNGKVIKGQQVFDIMGGRITKPKEANKFGEESKVIVAWGCVEGIDWSEDADRDDGGVRQEMGQTFDDKFGRVERIYVNLSSESQPVYIKFASELSALNAVNRFHEGYMFRGRSIRAQYYNEAKFEASVFDH